MRLRIIWRTSPQSVGETILLGALVRVYGKDEGGVATAVWLAESEEETGQSLPGIGQSIAHETIEALRKMGLLDDIVATKEGLVVYPTELNRLEKDD